MRTPPLGPPRAGLGPADDMNQPEKHSSTRSYLIISALLAGCGSEPAAKSPTGQPGQTSPLPSGTSDAGEPAAGAEAPIGNSEGDQPSREVERDALGTPPGEDAIRPLPEGTKVLHVGDSFAGALGLPLGELFETAGLRSVLKHTDSSYLTDWAWDGNLQKYLWKYNPDLVLVTLGANELEIAKPEQREKTVKKIIATIGDRPCVWVAIPLWDGPKNGLLDVIQKHSSPCIYMDTNTLFDPRNMPRIHDGIHPTTEARKKWAEDVLEWLKVHRDPQAGRPWNLRE